MADPFTDADLEAYLDEGLPPAEMARIETAARGDEALLRGWPASTRGATSADTRWARSGAFIG